MTIGYMNDKETEKSALIKPYSTTSLPCFVTVPSTLQVYSNTWSGKREPSQVFKCWNMTTDKHYQTISLPLLKKSYPLLKKTLLWDKEA